MLKGDGETGAQITKAIPRAGVEGGEVVLSCSGYDASDHRACRVYFGEHRGRVVSASSSRVIVALPEYETGACADSLRLESASKSDSISFALGTKLAENLHPVSNPAIDQDDGSIYVTLSGTRGQKVPCSIFKIESDGQLEPFLSEIVNPTGLAFDRDGTLFVTSRYDGTLYRVSHFKEVTEFATDLGIATGLAFDRSGTAYVGDRSGTIFQVNEIGETRPFATLEASVSAYHLAFSPEGDLFVTGPTVSSFDSVIRIDAMGNVSRFYTGLGRPQGLAFDSDGNLYVAASLRGHRGIVRITADGRNAEVAVSGSALVGVAFDHKGNLIVTATQKVYQVPFDAKGYTVF